MRPYNVIATGIVALVTAGSLGAQAAPAQPPAAPPSKPPATQPAPAPAAGAPNTSAPTFAKQLGLMVYPAKGQSTDQLYKDDRECYVWAKEQTGFDPATAKTANADSAGKAAAGAVAPGGAVKGAAKGAAAGAAVGAIAGDAGEGAAIGAVVGTAGGRRKQKAGKAAAGQQAAAQTSAANKSQVDGFKRGMSTCLQGRGYSVQ